MKWTNAMGNTYALTWRPWSVVVHAFIDGYYREAGTAKGFLIKVRTWHGDAFFVKPSSVLFTKQDIEDRDSRMVSTMENHVEWEDCDCGCESQTPKNEWSCAWLRAASVVRCEPMVSTYIKD